MMLRLCLTGSKSSTLSFHIIIYTATIHHLDTEKNLFRDYLRFFYYLKKNSAPILISTTKRPGPDIPCFIKIFTPDKSQLVTRRAKSSSSLALSNGLLFFLNLLLSFVVYILNNGYWD